MIRLGRLTSTGISLADEDAAGICASCFGPRSKEISYRDIVAVGEQQNDIVEVTYLERSQQPFRLQSKVLRISTEPKVNPQSSQEFLTGPTGFASDGTEDGTEAANVHDIILARAYANVGLPKDRARVLVLVNPHSGSGHSRVRYDHHAAPVFAAAGLPTTVINTRFAGEASGIAKTVSLEEYGSIVSVSGDGLPHEVINGLAQREDAVQALSHFALAQLPGGSGNAMCLSLNDGENDWAAVALGIVKGSAEPVDLMAVTQGNNTFYSFLSQSYGIVADCDLGTEDWRWMGGARFTVGIVLKCLAANQYPCEIAYKETDALSQSHISTTSLTPKYSLDDPVPGDWTVEKHLKLSMFYVGKMEWMSYDAHVFPRAEALDGAMDMLVWDTSFGSVSALHALSKFETGQHMSLVPFYKKVSAYRITPLVNDQYVSIDGESYPCEPFQVEVLPGAAKFIMPI